MTDIPAIPATKYCTKCGEWKPATAEYFSRDKARKSGLSSWCRKCLKVANREYRRKNKDAIAEAQRMRYSKNAHNKKVKYKSQVWCKKIDNNDDYSDLAPIPEDGGFRQWAVITSKEYGAVMRPSAPEEKEN